MTNLEVEERFAFTEEEKVMRILRGQCLHSKGWRTTASALRNWPPDNEATTSLWACNECYEMYMINDNSKTDTPKLVRLTQKDENEYNR